MPPGNSCAFGAIHFGVPPGQWTRKGRSSAQAGADSASDTPRRMSGWWSQCPWGKSSAPTHGADALFHLSASGGKRYLVWRDTQVPPYGRLSFPFAIHPAWAAGSGLGWAEQSPAPTDGYRFRLPFIWRGRVSLPGSGRQRQ